MINRLAISLTFLVVTASLIIALFEAGKDEVLEKDLLTYTEGVK